MSIKSEVARLTAAKNAIAQAIEYKGVTVPSNAKLDDMDALIRQIYGGDKVYWGICSTGASTQAKVVSISGVTELTNGLSIRIKFSNAQTYSGAPTLNLNNLGAKNICRYSGKNAGQHEWGTGEVLDLVYDGSVWIIVNGGSLKVG